MTATARRTALLILAMCAALLGPAPASCAPSTLTLTLDGKPVTLAGGLATSGDGTQWITRSDLRIAFGVHVKALIPRPIDRVRQRRRRGETGWILCGIARSATYGGKTGGTDAEPTFERPKVLRAVG